MTIITIIVSAVTSLIVAAFITMLGCYGFKIYIEKEVNRVLDEEGERTEEYVLEVINLAQESIRNAHVYK